MYQSRGYYAGSYVDRSPIIEYHPVKRTQEVVERGDYRRGVEDLDNTDLDRRVLKMDNREFEIDNRGIRVDRIHDDYRREKVYERKIDEFGRSYDRRIVDKPTNSDRVYEDRVVYRKEYDHKNDYPSYDVNVKTIERERSGMVDSTDTRRERDVREGKNNQLFIDDQRVLEDRYGGRLDKRDYREVMNDAVYEKKRGGKGKKEQRIKTRYGSMDRLLDGREGYEDAEVTKSTYYDAANFDIRNDRDLDERDAEVRRYRTDDDRTYDRRNTRNFNDRVVRNADVRGIEYRDGDRDAIFKKIYTVEDNVEYASDVPRERIFSRDVQERNDLIEKKRIEIKKHGELSDDENVNFRSLRDLERERFYNERKNSDELLTQRVVRQEGRPGYREDIYQNYTGPYDDFYYKEKDTRVKQLPRVEGDIRYDKKYEEVVRIDNREPIIRQERSAEYRSYPGTERMVKDQTIHYEISDPVRQTARIETSGPIYKHEARTETAYPAYERDRREYEVSRNTRIAEEEKDQGFLKNAKDFVEDKIEIIGEKTEELVDNIKDGLKSNKENLPVETKYSNQAVYQKPAKGVVYSDPKLSAKTGSYYRPFFHKMTTQTIQPEMLPATFLSMGCFANEEEFSNKAEKLFKRLTSSPIEDSKISEKQLHVNTESVGFAAPKHDYNSLKMFLKPSSETNSLNKFFKNKYLITVIHPFDTIKYKGTHGKDIFYYITEGNNNLACWIFHANGASEQVDRLISSAMLKQNIKEISTLSASSSVDEAVVLKTTEKTVQEDFKRRGDVVDNGVVTRYHDEDKYHKQYEAPVETRKVEYKKDSVPMHLVPYAREEVVHTKETNVVRGYNDRYKPQDQVVVSEYETRGDDALRNRGYNSTRIVFNDSDDEDLRKPHNYSNYGTYQRADSPRRTARDYNNLVKIETSTDRRLHSYDKDTDRRRLTTDEAWRKTADRQNKARYDDVLYQKRSDHLTDLYDAPTTTEIPCFYLGSLKLNKATDIDEIDNAVDFLTKTTNPSTNQKVILRISSSRIYILDYKDMSRVILKSSVKNLTYAGIFARNKKFGVMVEDADRYMVAHVFLMEPSADYFYKTISSTLVRSNEERTLNRKIYGR